MVQMGKLSTPEIFLECYCVARKKPIRRGFVASTHVLIFAVIGYNTINIPEIFQVFKVFPVTL